MELLGDLPPIPVVAHPRQRRCAISCVDFKHVEARRDTKGDRGGRLPKTGPLDHSTVLVDGLTLLEAEICIGLHGWRLDEGLELVAWVSRCALNTENSLDGLLAKNRVTKTISHMRELLIISPLDLVLAAFIVVVLVGGGTILQGLLIINFLGLGEPGACWLSPSVVVLKEPILEVIIVALRERGLIEALGNVRLVVEVFGAYLSNV